MSTYDWLLFLHLVGAAAVFAALALFAAVLLATSPGRPGEGVELQPFVRLGGVLFDLGGLLLVVFGIWLAFEADYGLTEGWVLAALLVYVVAALGGTRTRNRLRAAGERAGAFYAVTVASVFVLLVLMIFKPGA